MTNPFAASDALFAEDVRDLMAPPAPPAERPTRLTDEDDRKGPIQLSVASLEPWHFTFDNGSKWGGGFGPTEILLPDYWTMRQRSVQLFETNLYARGIVRRMITNEINVGLHLEATPFEKILGFTEDALAEWTEDVEDRFELWGETPVACDQLQLRTWGQIQEAARLESLIAGDVLVVLRQDPRTRVPRVQLIGGQSIQTPINYRSQQYGTLIKYGVELDQQGRHVAYHVKQPDGTTNRLPAYGEKSGRHLAWLVYGCENKLEDTRGKPLLALMLQMVRDIDRYRDATLVKAQLNAMLAMFVTKTQDKPNTMPLTNGAVRRGSEAVMDTNVTPRRFSTQEHIPGLVIEELQVGEEPRAFPNNGTDEKFGGFEAALLSLAAWGNEIPPEILTLSFNSNYSASQAAINEFKMVLNRNRTRFGANFCQPTYQDWLISETLAGRIKARGLLESWKDPAKFEQFAAWVSADWSGNVKPAVDLSKLVSGYEGMTRNGWITNDRASRELTGMKHSKVVKILKRENAALAEALTPIRALDAPVVAPSKSAGSGINEESIDKESPEDDE